MLENVHYDEQAPVMDQEQIDMLIMCEEGDADTTLARELLSYLPMKVLQS